MKLSIDTHTHTVLSGHAHSTLLENIMFAKKKGLSGIVVTDHSGGMEGVQTAACVGLLRDVPQEYEGIRIYRGTETNIVNQKGEVDMPLRYLQFVEFAIASLHDNVIRSVDQAHDTDAMIGALNNPYIDIIGHPGNPFFKIDIEAVVLEAKKQNKLIEINGHSFTARKGSRPNCQKFLQLCKKHGVRISVGTDSHNCFCIGEFGPALEEIEAAGFPEELIVSRTKESFEAYLAERQARIAALAE